LDVFLVALRKKYPILGGGKLCILLAINWVTV
jgi:hypothetical protein